MEQGVLGVELGNFFLLGVGRFTKVNNHVPVSFSNNDEGITEELTILFNKCTLVVFGKKSILS